MKIGFVVNDIETEKAEYTTNRLRGAAYSSRAPPLCSTTRSGPTWSPRPTAATSRSR